MKRAHFDCPDEPAFLAEVLRSVESVDGKDEKVKVLARAFRAFRGLCLAQSAISLDEETEAGKDGVTVLLKGAAMHYPEGEWRRFADLLYPKEGPMMERIREAAKKHTGAG